MQKEDFLQAIQANPGNTRLRLMYADWLEERGDPMAQEWRQPVQRFAVGSDHLGSGLGDGSQYGFGYADGDGGCEPDNWGRGRYGGAHGDGASVGEAFQERVAAYGRSGTRINEVPDLHIPWLDEAGTFVTVELPDGANYYDYYIASRRRQRNPFTGYTAPSWIYVLLGISGLIAAGISTYLLVVLSSLLVPLLFLLLPIAILVFFIYFVETYPWFRGRRDLLIFVLLAVLTWGGAILVKFFIAVSVVIENSG